MFIRQTLKPGRFLSARITSAAITFVIFTVGICLGRVSNVMSERIRMLISTKLANVKYKQILQLNTTMLIDIGYVNVLYEVTHEPEMLDVFEVLIV